MSSKTNSESGDTQVEQNSDIDNKIEQANRAYRELQATKDREIATLQRELKEMRAEQEAFKASVDAMVEGLEDKGVRDKIVSHRDEIELKRYREERARALELSEAKAEAVRKYDVPVEALEKASTKEQVIDQVLEYYKSNSKVSTQETSEEEEIETAPITKPSLFQSVPARQPLVTRSETAVIDEEYRGKAKTSGRSASLDWLRAGGGLVNTGNETKAKV